jgi:hypothetical protein
MYCVIIFIIILFVCSLCYASKHEAALRRLYLLAKEAEPELTYTLWKERRLHAAADLRMKKIFGFKPANQTGNGISITSYMFSRVPWSTAPKLEDEEKLVGEESEADKGVAMPMPLPRRTPTCNSEAPPAYESIPMETPVCWWDALVLRIT